jgi:antitoxin component of RelBE/YafQ-DinJ toxin-antitoxin module
MVQAIVRIDEDTNRVLNIVKAKYGLKDKSQAINIMAQQYKEELLEPELRPQYIDKLKKLEKQKGIPFKSLTQLRKIIEG